MVKSIEINKEWFYRATNPFSLENILSKGAVLSKRRIFPNSKLSHDNSWNGLDYVSCSKRYDDLIYDSSYHKFSYGNYALIFDNIVAIKTRYIRYYYDFFRMISKINKTRRYSCYKDEYQVKDLIPISKIIGIKIPEREFDASPNTSNMIVQDRCIDNFIDIINKYNFNIPFIDVEFGKSVSCNDIKQYRKER